MDYNSIVTATLQVGANDIPDGGTIAAPVILSGGVPDGRLEFKKSPDYEIQPEYRVTIKATDPGNDYKYVNVRITITNVNEIPEREKPAGISHRVPYPENATKVVSTYEGNDPESPTFIYSLVDTAGPLYLGIARDIDADPDEEASDVDGFHDSYHFCWLTLLIRPCSRSTAIPVNSEFKASPNYEDPKDSDDDDDGGPCETPLRTRGSTRWWRTRMPDTTTFTM